MDSILAVYETEKIARKLLGKNNKGSCWPLLLLIEISKKPSGEYVKLVDVVRQLTGVRKVTSFHHFIAPIAEYLELTKMPSKGSTFDAHYARLRLGVLDRVALSSLDGRTAQQLHERVTVFMRVHGRATPIVWLINIGISVRKYGLSKEISDYIESIDTSGSSTYHSLCKMAELGQAQIIKTANHRGAECYVFEVQ